MSSSTIVDLDELRSLRAEISNMAHQLDMESDKLTKAGEACMSVLSHDKLSVMYATELEILIREIKKYSKMLHEYAAAIGERIIKIEILSKS